MSMPNKAEDGFEYLLSSTGEVGEALLNVYATTVAASTLDKKTHQLVYIAYLAAIKQYGGLEVHVKILKELGATRAEVESAILCGLLPIGISLSKAYQVAMNAYDSE